MATHNFFTMSAPSSSPSPYVPSSMSIEQKRGIDPTLRNILLVVGILALSGSGVAAMKSILGLKADVERLTKESANQKEASEAELSGLRARFNQEVKQLTDESNKARLKTMNAESDRNHWKFEAGHIASVNNGNLRLLSEAIREREEVEKQAKKEMDAIDGLREALQREQGAKGEAQNKAKEESKKANERLNELLEARRQKEETDRLAKDLQKRKEELEQALKQKEAEADREKQAKEELQKKLEGAKSDAEKLDIITENTLGLTAEVLESLKKHILFDGNLQDECTLEDGPLSARNCKVFTDWEKFAAEGKVRIMYSPAGMPVIALENRKVYDLSLVLLKTFGGRDEKGDNVVTRYNARALDRLVYLVEEGNKRGLDRFTDPSK